MGRFTSGLTDLFKSADEAGSKADEGAGLDESFVSDDGTKTDFDGENVAGNNESFEDFAEESFSKRLAADANARLWDGLGDTPSSYGDNAESIAKYGAGAGVAGAGLWAGTNIYDDYSATAETESKERSYEELLAAIKAVRENDNLSPEEKAERIEQLREDYHRAVELAKGGGSLGGVVKQAYNELFGGMGMMGKVAILALLVGGYYAYQNGGA